MGKSDLQWLLFIRGLDSLTNTSASQLTGWKDINDTNPSIWANPTRKHHLKTLCLCTPKTEIVNCTILKWYWSKGNISL